MRSPTVGCVSDEIANSIPAIKGSFCSAACSGSGDANDEGMIQLVYSTTCPAGWKEKTELRGQVIAGAPPGAGGTTNKQPPLGVNETGRVGPHGHAATAKITDPGHTHANTLTDPGHTHKATVTDPGHGHDLTDPGHAHETMWLGESPTPDEGTGWIGDHGTYGNNLRSDSNRTPASPSTLASPA